MESPRWKIITPSQYEWERRALDFIRTGLPDYDPYRAWANFEFQTAYGAIYEVDLLVLTKQGFWLVECKAWSGRISGDSGTWTRSHNGEVGTEDNPLLLANRKAKALSSLLKTRPAAEKVWLPWLDALVFLSADDVRCDLTGTACNRVLLKDRPADGTQPERKGILAALTSRIGPGIDPDPRGIIDIKVAKAISRAMEQTGIHPSQRSRRIGDYILGDLIFDGPGYQDRLTKHPSFENVFRRVRQYTVAQAATEEERQRLKRAAAREFQILQTLDHQGILPVLEYKEHENGPALVFGYSDPNAVRFDHFLASNSHKLATDQRLNFLHQIADAIRYAHSKRVIHRSLGPQSILVRDASSFAPRLQIYNWQVGVRETTTTTFSRVTNVEDLVEAQALVYMSPEALSDSRKVTEASDVFSLGAIAFHLFASRPPASNATELARILQDQKGLSISSVWDGAGPKLQELIQWSTHPDVLTRIGTVEDFLSLLDEVEDELTTPGEAVVNDPLLAKRGDHLPNGYVVERVIGQGATATALLATKDGREFVLKVALTEEYNARLHEEAEALRAIHSEFVVAIENELTMSGRTVLVLQKAGDRTLASLLANEGVPSLALLSQYGDDLLSAVSSLERHGVTHRDIKPDNIGVRSLTKGGNQLVLFDFSLAHAPLDHINTGTEGYRDPFLKLRKPPQWDLAAERYSVAVTLYEMTLGSGCLPQWGKDKSDPALTNDELVIEAEKIDPSVRDGLGKFFRKALNREPTQRFANAEQMRWAWQNIFKEAEQRQITPPSGEKVEPMLSTATAPNDYAAARPPEMVHDKALTTPAFNLHARQTNKEGFTDKDLVVRYVMNGHYDASVEAIKAALFADRPPGNTPADATIKFWASLRGGIPRMTRDLARNDKRFAAFFDPTTGNYIRDDTQWKVIVPAVQAALAATPSMALTMQPEPVSPRVVSDQADQATGATIMHHDSEDRYRALLEKDPPAFLDRVNTPWDHVPDFEEYNQRPYRRIVRALQQVSQKRSSDTESNSRGILILGEAGTGKTHLLMRVARTLSESNHILFVRKPNNEDAVAQHIWANVISSLTRLLPTSGKERSQLDDLLAHVFSKVLIPEFERDIAEGTDVEQRQRWVGRLTSDPYNLFNMLGEGERRQENMEKIRRRTLRFLQTQHPDVDQKIAHVLITYCFVAREDRKRVLLTWLSGQDVDEGEAKDLSLPPSWVTIDETSSDISTQQQREEQALPAIQTIGILSTYYQPLILSFDQLEGLRDQPRLTHRWGDVVREIFTMTPNFLIITCIFPSLWQSWFSKVLDRSVTERIAQQTVDLDTFAPHHGRRMLETHMESSFYEHRLPTSIYPFTTDDIDALCTRATSPRSFIQSARSMFESWLDGKDHLIPGVDEPAIVTQDAVDSTIRETLAKFEDEERKNYGIEIPIEQDFFGRIRNLVGTVLSFSGNGEQVDYAKATCNQYVMPPNVVVKSRRSSDSICIAVMNSDGNAFAARIRNLRKTVQAGDQFKNVVIVRDRRCRQIGAKSQEYLREVESRGGVFIHANTDEITALNALYDTLVAVEEHDLTVGTHEIGKPQFVQFVKTSGELGKTELFRHAGRLARFFGLTEKAPPLASVPQRDRGPQAVVAPPSASLKYQPVVSRQPVANEPRLKARPQDLVQVLIGDTNLDSPHLGVIGELRDDHRRLGLSLTKPQCVVLLGYMGSGKSYALGVLIENALLSSSTLIRQTRPMSVVAFNYRRNPESRFEYWGFSQPNTDNDETETLLSKYGAQPNAVSKINVFGYEQEIPRRRGDYRDLPSFPIQFKPDELGAEHWEILMKPPSLQSEYMDIVRDIIQKLFYQERLSFKNLKRHIQTDERLSESQRRRAMNRLSFAERWIADERSYEWADVLQEGTLNVFDLRMQTLESSEALKLCLIITDLVRRTRNGVNKLIVFDEAHEYVDSKELVSELENAITQIRHDGLSFVLASQFPDRIPERIFKYLLTRMVFKLPNAKAINFVRKAAPNLEPLSPQRVANLDLEQGVCFIQTDDDCTDSLLKVPQLLEVRPRCTLHGGATIRQVGVSPSQSDGVAQSVGTEAVDAAELEASEVESCPKCGKELVLRRGPVGPFIGCSGYPSCRYSRSIS